MPGRLEVKRASEDDHGPDWGLVIKDNTVNSVTKLPDTIGILAHAAHPGVVSGTKVSRQSTEIDADGPVTVSDNTIEDADQPMSGGIDGGNNVIIRSLRERADVQSMPLRSRSNTRRRHWLPSCPLAANFHPRRASHFLEYGALVWGRGKEGSRW